jgi:3-oxocholest-4-en-26-oate---CoA ligase
MSAPKMSVAAALRATAEASGDRTALIHGDRRIGHAELADRARRLAGALAEGGVGQGSVVAIALYNSIEYLVMVLAAFQLGAQPTNVNYRYREQELSDVLHQTAAAALVYDASLRERVRPAAARLPALGMLVETGGDTEPPAPVVSFERAAGHDPVPSDLAEGSPHGIILLTGGTTGRPKGVVWDRDGLLGIITSVFRQRGLPVPTTTDEVRARVRELHERDAAPVVLPMSPLIHGTGFFHALRTLLAGGTVCFCASRSLDADEVWRTVQRHAVGEMVIVGDAFGRPLVDALATAERAGRPYDISSLRAMTSSGVLWSVEVKRELLRRGHDLTLIDNISASEGGPFGHAEARTEADLADGRFSLSPVARVLDEHDRDIRPGSGQVGVLASAGPQPVGYLNDPDRTARTWRTIDGVRHAVPGDLATLDADGKLVLLGRGDSVINTGGEKVFPEEVEQALLTHPGIADAVVVGVPDARWGQVVTALVAPASALTAVTDDAVTTYVGDRLAGYKRPRHIVRVDAVPRSPAGKLNRALARELATRTVEETSR